MLGWRAIIRFQELFYPDWKINKSRLLFSTALAAEVGEVCGIITHLDGGGTNLREYSEHQVLHQAVDSYIQLVLLVVRSGFSEQDFEKEFHSVIEELYDRLHRKTMGNKK